MTNELQQLQEYAHGKGYDYRDNAPHLRHTHLYDWFTSDLRHEIQHVVKLGLPMKVLEIGAGDGAFVEPLLAAGASVTATEMSRDSVDALRSRFQTNPKFEVVFDADGALDILGERRYAIVLYASVLHHIPDYIAALTNACDRHLMVGGTLITLQDPMWYPSLPRGVRATSEAMYLSWRLTRGNLLRGVRSRNRRMRNHLRPDEPSDMVEYHAIRNGVDQDSIERLLEIRFEQVGVTRYWSAHALIWQRAGERLGLRNTFTLRARRWRGVEAPTK
ncbi:MAG: class I SAM-dependent methyltransferase [Solirubrobacteraceae bacterium]